MIIAYKNYKRTENVLLSITSARYFMPSVSIFCLNLFDSSSEEYMDSIEYFNKLNVNILFARSKYSCGPGAFSNCNGLYFTEYLNYFSQIFANEKKVLILDEDNYFTTGETLHWVNNTEFDLAWAHWPPPPEYPKIGINASIIGINFQSLGILFPITEKQEYIELILLDELYHKACNMGAQVKEIPTRNFTNYFGDGTHTNDINQIKKDLLAAQIISENIL